MFPSIGDGHKRDETKTSIKRHIEMLPPIRQEHVPLLAEPWADWADRADRFCFYAESRSIFMRD
jgi:hypothetical protein